MSDKFDPKREVGDILAKSRKNLQERIEAFRIQIKEVRERELAKSLVPVHEHRPGTTAGGGTEDVPYGKLNPKGVDKSVKKNTMNGYGGTNTPPVPNAQPTMAKGEMCKKCGNMHMPLEKCGQIKVGKAELIDEMGRRSTNSEVTPFKEGNKAPKIPAKGSGGVKLPGAGLKKAMTAGMGSGAPGTKVNDLGKAAGAPKAKAPSVAMSGNLPPGKLPVKESNGGVAKPKVMTVQPDAEHKSELDKSILGSASSVKRAPAPAKPPAQPKQKTSISVTSMSPAMPALKSEALSKPSVSAAQHRAMGAAAGGNSTLGIPKSVGKEFVHADKGKTFKSEQTEGEDLEKGLLDKLIPKHVAIPAMMGLAGLGAVGAKTGFDAGVNHIVHNQQVEHQNQQDKQWMADHPNDLPMSGGLNARKPVKLPGSHLKRTAPDAPDSAVGNEATDKTVGSSTFKAEPPMAKPPSGANMGTAVPSSKPGNAMKPAMKKELAKGMFSQAAQNADPISASHAALKPAAPAMKMPSPGAQAGRAAGFSAAAAGAFQPKGPINSGLELAPKAPKAGAAMGLKSPKAAGAVPAMKSLNMPSKQPSVMNPQSTLNSPKPPSIAPVTPKPAAPAKPAGGPGIFGKIGGFRKP